jgi:carbonic anhydrase
MRLGLVFAFSGGCASDTVSWRYDEAATWHAQAPNVACQGKEQSPIDIREVIPRDLPNLAFRYGQTPLALSHNGAHLLQKVSEGHALKIGAQVFALEKVTFHTPGEHLAVGETFPMEMQLWHRNAAGNYAIVSVMVRQGRTNPLLAGIAGALPAPGQTLEAGAVVSLQRLLPQSRQYMRYAGSLSTPPCWEHVMRFVLVEPVEAAASEIAAIAAAAPESRRPAMPISGRRVYLDRTP